MNKFSNLIGALVLTSFAGVALANPPASDAPFDTSKLKEGTRKEWVMKNIPGYEGSKIESDDDPVCTRDKMTSTFKNKHGDVLNIIFCDANMISYNLKPKK